MATRSRTPLLRLHLAGWHFAAGLSLLAVVLFPVNCAAQESSPPPGAGVAPTLEALPHVSLAHGIFKGWCGRKDRFLLGVNGQLEAYDAGVKAATIAISSSWPIQCSEDGQQLIYIDTHMGYVTKVDIATGASQLLASYAVDENDHAEVALSPDLQRVAANRPLRSRDQAGNLKVIPASASHAVRAIKWNDDGSMFFVAGFREVQVSDAEGKKLGSGLLPKDTFFRDGWLDTGEQSLVLYLGLDHDEFGPGVLIKCRIGEWKCTRPGSRVDSVSWGGHGVAGTVIPLGKVSRSSDDDGGTSPVYPKYSVEIHGPGSGLLARQIFSTTGARGRTDFSVSIAPSGRAAILTWDADPAAECRSPDSRCQQGMLIDLGKVRR